MNAVSHLKMAEHRLKRVKTSSSAGNATASISGEFQRVLSIDILKEQ
jgi:hypothetical protein